MITLLDTVGPAVLRASGHAAVLALVVMLLVKVGLTDAMPVVPASQSSAKPAPVWDEEKKPEVKTVALRGRCVDRVDKSPMARATVHLFKAQGRTARSEEHTSELQSPA